MLRSMVYCGALSVLVASTACCSAADVEPLGEADAVSLLETAPSSFQRTIVFIHGETWPGQDMFIRGGVDHGAAEQLLGKPCSTSNTECAIPIHHLNLKNTTTEPWKTGDTQLDWYGREASQTGTSGGEPAQGTALDWSTNDWPSSWGAAKTVAADGYGVEPLNMFGAHVWMLDVEMDCSKAFPYEGNAWFEVKSFISNGPGWEGDVHQAGTPYPSINHFGQCGKLNVFRRGDSTALILPTEARDDPYIVGAGDIAYNNGGAAQTASLLSALAPGAAAVFTAGDNTQGNASTEADKMAEYQGWFAPTWGKFLSKLRPAAGNHDFYVAKPYYDYFGAAAGPRGLGYYSYDVGADWHAVVLNSNILSAEQLDWLKGDLAANSSKHVFACWHHPRFSSGQHGDEAALQPYWQALHDHKAEFVFNGHDHHYERFAPQSPSGARDDAGGIREFVVGTGGMSMRPFKSVRPNSEVRETGTWGVLKMVLHPSWYEWVFVPVAGKSFFDTGFAPCHALN